MIKHRFSWINYIHNRIKNNKNFLATLTGKTGSGKSWSALSMGEMLDKDFNIKRIIFKAEDLMDLINNGNLKRGSVIIWDEAGIDLSNRNWQSNINKMLNFLLQTFRHKNFILILTVPYQDFLDASSRKLFHADIETVSIDKREKRVIVKPKLLQYNPGMKKWYRKYLRVRKSEQRYKAIRRWGIPKPSDELIESYERKKNVFTKKLNNEIQQSIKAIRENKEKKKELTENQKNILNCWKEGIFKQIDMAAKLNTPQGGISSNIARMRRKGYYQEDYSGE